MANGQGSGNPITNVVTDYLSHNVTKLGMGGASLYVLAQLTLSIIHKSLDGALQATGYCGLLLVGWGAAIRSKRTNTMIATTTAEAVIGRAAIANSLAPTEADIVAPASADPAVQNEIDKRLTR
jgi:hypothetical protein